MGLIRNCVSHSAAAPRAKLEPSLFTYKGSRQSLGVTIRASESLRNFRTPNVDSIDWIVGKLFAKLNEHEKENNSCSQTHSFLSDSRHSADVKRHGGPDGPQDQFYSRRSVGGQS